MSLLQKCPLGRAENIKNGNRGKKCDFFKVKDNDTTIQPGEKEGQTDLSSALPRFGDHHSGSWEVFKILIFWPPPYRFTGLLYRTGFVEAKNSKNWKLFKNRCGGRQTFLGPN